MTIMLLAAGREVVSKTSAYNITKLSYRVEVRVGNDSLLQPHTLLGLLKHFARTFLRRKNTVICFLFLAYLYNYSETSIRRTPWEK